MPSVAPKRQVTLLPKALQAWRKERQWSQATLAKKAGVSEGLIAQIETGRRQPGIENALALASAIGVDIGAICFVHVDLSGAVGEVTPIEAVA